MKFLQHPLKMTGALTAAVTVGTVMLGFAAAPASADPPYPGPTTPSTTQPGVTFPGTLQSSTGSDTIGPGQSANVTFPSYLPNSQALVELDGQYVSDVKSVSNGEILLTFLVLSGGNGAALGSGATGMVAAIGAGPLFAAGSSGRLTLSINGTNVPVTAGNHAITVSGTGADGQPRVSSVAFAVSATPVGSSATTSGGLAFTGANILKWSIVALALLAIGTFLVVADRRRSAKVGNT